MITVELIKKEGASCGFIAHGHAGFAEYGSDIVCSAVSALTQTALIGIIETVKAKTDWFVNDKGGIVCMVRDTDLQKRSEAALVLDVMYGGLHSIQERYTDYLSVSEREVKTNV